LVWAPSRLTHFLDNLLTDGGEVASITRRPLFTPGRFLVLISVRGRVDSRAIVRPEGLGKLEKIHFIGNRSLDLPACSIVPQPTTLLRAHTVLKAAKLYSYFQIIQFDNSENQNSAAPLSNHYYEPL
jgi:hypothetical protein